MLLPSCIRSNPLLMSGSGMMARALFGEMDHGFATEKEHRSVPEFMPDEGRVYFTRKAT